MRYRVLVQYSFALSRRRASVFQKTIWDTHVLAFSDNPIILSEVQPSQTHGRSSLRCLFRTQDSSLDHVLRLKTVIFLFCASLPILLYCHGTSGALTLDTARWYGGPLCGRTDAAGESLGFRCSFCRFHIYVPLIDR